MVDTRSPISEMHLGKFPDSMEFQSWQVNFKTEVCSESADPRLTMHRIKEVEIAKSIDELVEKAARHACALPKKSTCRRATRSKIRPILTMEARLLTRSASIFVHLEPVKQYKDSQICSIHACRMTTSKISMYDGTELYYHQAMFLQKWSWKVHTSRNYRILFSFRRSWLCTTKKLSETMDNRVIQV